VPIEAKEIIRLIMAISFEVLLLIDLIKTIILKINAATPENIAHAPISGTNANARFSMQNISVTVLNTFQL
jgi:hypothetical protein